MPFVANPALFDSNHNGIILPWYNDTSMDNSKIEALRLAVAAKPEPHDVLSLAKEFYAFLTDKNITPHKTDSEQS